MSCYGCGDKFSFFKKEHGCKNCGYSFCGSCVSKKTSIPKFQGEKHKVCDNCYNILTGKKQQQQKPVFDPPEAYLKRMAALEDKNKPAVQRPKVKATRNRGMSVEDEALAARLERLKQLRKQESLPVPTEREMEARLAKLKEGRPPPPSTTEISERLSKLQGHDPTKVAKDATVFVYRKDSRMEQQQIDDLMKLVNEEVAIDNRHSGSTTTEEGDAQNNLDRESCPLSKEYHKNISQEDSQSEASAQEDSQSEASAQDGGLNEINQLIQVVAKEMEVDAQRAVEGLQKDKDLMERLQQLKKERKKKGGQEEKPAESTAAQVDSESDEDNEEELTKLIIQQVLEQNRLEEEEEKAGLSKMIDTLPSPTEGAQSSGAQSSTSTSKSSTSASASAAGASAVAAAEDEDSDELPWCCICTEDATLRCIGCDGDLYCNRCYKEGHDSLDLEDHQTVSYKAR